jgi:hypothetical protein
LCTELHHAYVAAADCARCTDLELPRRLPPRVGAQELQAALAASASCRGGAPSTEAFVAPLDGIWIHAGPSGAVELLPCQSAPLRENGVVVRAGACEGLPASTNATARAAWRAGRVATGQLAAICGTGKTLCVQKLVFV